MNYLWKDNLTPPEFPRLEGNTKTDVLVIGGGMAGVLCAAQLKKSGVDCILTEGEKIGNKITKGTTAVLSAQHDILYSDMIRDFGATYAKLYLEVNLRAVEKFRELSKDIPCDFEEKPSYMYSLHDGSRMKQEAEAVNSLGFDAVFSLETPLPFRVAGAVYYPGMAQFHPLKFLYGVAKKENLNIYENTFVYKLKGTTAYTKNGTIRAKKVIVATHFPFINLHGLYPVKMYQQNAYAVAYENAPDLGCTVIDAAENGIFLRNYNGLLIVGGGSHRTGKKGGGFNVPRDFAKKYFPDAKEKYAWINQDCISLDGIPYIGHYGKLLPDVYTATGFNLWGMTTSMAASEILSDLTAGRYNRYAQVFAPDRKMKAGKALANIGISALNLLSPTVKRCPHLGCALKWNSAEHSWDCPCHGSRFKENGEMINGPAMRNAHVKQTN